MNSIKLFYLVIIALAAIIIVQNVSAAILSVALDSPVNDNWTSDVNIPFNFTAQSSTDENFNCTLIIDAVAYGTNALTMNNTLTSFIPNVSLSTGNFFWLIECEDSNNTPVQSEARTLYVDNIAPVVNINSPDDLFVTNDNTPIIVFYGTDNMAEEMVYRVYVNDVYDESTGSIGNSSGSVTISVNLSERAAGNHTFIVQLTDFAGNAQNSTERTITVAVYPTSAPVLEKSGVADSNNDGNIRINWTADIEATTYRIYRDNEEITDATGLTMLAETD